MISIPVALGAQTERPSLVQTIDRTSAKPPARAALGVGDVMPRITLPSASGAVFDSWDQLTYGMARAYWLGAPPDSATAARLSEDLAASETLLHVVLTCAPPATAHYPCWLLDRDGERPARRPRRPWRARGGAVAGAVAGRDREAGG